MRHRLTADNIQAIKAVLSQHGLKKTGNEFLFFLQGSPDVEEILNFLESKTNLQTGFVPHFLSVNGESGLRYVNPILGYDNYSREWHIGDIKIWKEATQKATFEDEWRRWIAFDFIDIVEERYGITISESANKLKMVRELYDFANRKAKYSQPNCLYDIKKIVEVIKIDDLDDFLEYKVA